MARNKHTALFEVIKAPPKPEPVLRASNSWFGKTEMAAPPAPEPAAEPVMAPEPSAYESMVEPASGDAHISIDPSRKEFIFRLSYTGAAVCSFGVMVGLVGAFVLGQRSSYSTIPVLAATTTDELQAGPAQPSVLDLGRPAQTETQAAPAQASTLAHVPVPEVALPPASAKENNRTWIEPQPPQTLVVQDAKRTIGLHYVLVQSYPKEEEAMAFAARDLLLKHGIDCTVEKGLPGWGPEWFSVMGTSGYDKVRSPDFEKYVRSIMTVSNTFAGSPKFKRFDPMAYKWRGRVGG